MFIKKDIVISKKDIVILPNNKNSIPINNIENLNKFDIKQNDKSYENIKKCFRKILNIV